MEDWRRLTRAIDACGQSLGISPSPDPLAEKVEGLAADADEIERRKNDPPGSAGAARSPFAETPPDRFPPPPGDDEDDKIDQEESDIFQRVVEVPTLVYDPEPVRKWIVPDVIPD
jgi:hypothetical protein